MEHEVLVLEPHLIGIRKALQGGSKQRHRPEHAGVPGLPDQVARWDLDPLPLVQVDLVEVILEVAPDLTQLAFPAPLGGEDTNPVPQQEVHACSWAMS